MGGDNKTPFTTIYDSFLTRVTDDMYMELTEVDTLQMLQDLLINAIPFFKFPKFDIYDYELGMLEDFGYYQGIESNNKKVPAIAWIDGFFNTKLTNEEINILSYLMVIEWLGQQLAITENTRMKYTGSDFKLTSQANHMAKLKNIIELYQKDATHLQNLYCRRAFRDGKVESTIGKILTTPGYGYNL